MFDGNQVLRFDNKYKSSDLGGLSVELTDRKGTGNYDIERKQFNIEYKTIESNLASTVYKTLTENNVSYGENKKNINLLNGAIITSGPEFFQNLGMKFKDSGRTYQVGEKEGQPILVPDIKNENDIPEKIKEYFKESYDFLSKYVGSENVVYASVHLDEDTPHMHFYFTPVVNEVRRKTFVTDNNNNLIKKEIIDKHGNKKLVPIQLKDENGKNIYTVEKGKFLNSDQFWKDKGGKTSFAKAQDEYNEYINSKGFNLFRGEIGSNKEHIDKATHNYNSIKNNVDNLKNEYKVLLNSSQLELETNKKIKAVDENLDVNKRKLLGYKESEIISLIDYSKQITKENIVNKNEINKLNYEINSLKSGKILTEKNKEINQLNKFINKQDKIIETLKLEVLGLKQKIEIITKAFTNKLNKTYKAIAKLLGAKDNIINHEDYEKKVDKIIKKDNMNKER